MVGVFFLLFLLGWWSSSDFPRDSDRRSDDVDDADGGGSVVCVKSSMFVSCDHGRVLVVHKCQRNFLRLGALDFRVTMFGTSGPTFQLN